MKLEIELPELETRPPKDDPLTFKITVGFPESEEKRWCELRDRLIRINSKLKMADYARISFIKTMDMVEAMLQEKEKSGRVDKAG
jgi:hypothetical protein